MLDEGCGDRSALDVHEALGRIGAQLDTDVGSRRDGHRPDDAAAIRWIAASSCSPTWSCGRASSSGKFDRVRELRLHRLLQLRDHAAGAVADRAFAQLLYRGHPYGHMPIGTEAVAARR